MFKTSKNLLLIVCFALYPLSLSAQIVPDNTLGAESSTIRSIDQLRDAIEGGAIRGDNLFHSFSEFNIPEGARVDFANPNSVANIFSRVTGGNISEIFGTLGVDGTANLFFMNPNGIVFGENAAIDVGGSFIATTAESIEFNSGESFSATSPNEPVLTLDFPIGLGMGSNSGSITIEDRGHSLDFSGETVIPTVRTSISPGLQANQGKNLAFIGEQVNLNGGVVIAEGGQIELAGIDRGFVGFELDLWKFDYSNVSNFGDISLTNTSWIDASSMPDSTAKGEIGIKGQNISIEDESVILMQNQNSNEAGDIKLDAVDSITISKVEIDPVAATPGGIISETLGEGSGSNIQISASNVSLQEGGSIITKTLGLQKAGDISIETFNKLNLIGVSEQDIPPVASNITSAAFPVGKTGTININTPSLILENGGSITNFVIGEAVGEAITIDTQDLLITGTDASGLYSSAITTNSAGRSQGADVFINAANLKLENGGLIGASTFDFSQPGNVNIYASNSIEATGFSNKTQIPSSISSTIFAQTEPVQEAFNQLDLNLSENITGNSGNVNIQTPNLKISNNASIAVLNQGTGDAGNLSIDAEVVALDDAVQISASTVSGQGGNITLDAQKLELSNQSQITASAGGAGDGGNITINSDSIIGSGNSDITANAVEGDGGNIEIESDVILGIDRSDRLTPFDDITATSEFGIDGTVTVNSPDTNADEDLVISAREIDVNLYQELFEGSCLDPNRNGRQEIVYVGGGRPESPYNFFDDEEPQALKDTYPTNSERSDSQSNNDVPPLWQEGDPLIEPNAVQTNADGRKFLVAIESREISEPTVCNRNAEDLEPE